MTASPCGKGERMTTGIMRAQDPDQLLPGGEAGEGPALGRLGDEALGHGVERRLGQRTGHPDHEGQQDLGHQGAPDGDAGRRRRRSATGGQQELLLAHPLA